MDGTLDRRLGLVGSAAIGAGAMIGAGLFVVFAPAVDAAGDGVLLALVVAAVIAGCNAHSSARLAALYPVAGGTYVYGCERLGPFWGHLAGWGFVVGKISSCAVMALAVGSYAWPEHHRVVALAVVVLVAAVNLCGVEKSAVASIAIVAVVLVVMTGVLVVLLVSPGTHAPGSASGPGGVLEAAGLLFFAFAGYARLATLGEEVRDPARTIPRAILISVVVVMAVYLAAGTALVHVLGIERLSTASRPFVTAVESAGADGLAPVVIGVAALAATGALLSLVLGVSRTVLAMARDGHLPAGLAVVDPRRRVPMHAEIAVAVVVGALVLVGDVATSVAFSSFCVLVYYAIANASALTLPSTPMPRAVAALGLLGCIVLAASLPPIAVLSGVAVLLVGAASYTARLVIA